MPLQTAALPRHRGWWRDQINARLVAVYNGTEIFDFDGNDIAISQTLTSNAALVTTVAAVAASAAGNGFRAATGNVTIGGAGDFLTIQAQGAVKMGGTSLTGIAPVGAIATAGAVFASNTAVMKIVAGGTADNIAQA